MEPKCVVVCSALNRRMLRNLLKMDGHLCEEAEDGLEAVSRFVGDGHGGEEKSDGNSASTKHFDVVLMDNNMPRMSGPSAAQELRRCVTDPFSRFYFCRVRISHMFCLQAWVQGCDTGHHRGCRRAHAARVRLGGRQRLPGQGGAPVPHCRCSRFYPAVASPPLRCGVVFSSLLRFPTAAGVPRRPPGPIRSGTGATGLEK